MISASDAFNDIAARLLRAVGELREAVADGTAADPAAAETLAAQMEDYARAVLDRGDGAAGDLLDLAGRR